MTSQISKEVKESFIFDNINELAIQDRLAILQIIYNSPDRRQLEEKGNGVQIKLQSISTKVLDDVYIAIKKKLQDQNLDL